MRKLRLALVFPLLALGLVLAVTTDAEACRRCRRHVEVICIPSWARFVDISEERAHIKFDPLFDCYCCKGMTWVLCEGMNPPCPLGRRVYVESGTTPIFQCLLPVHIVSSADRGTVRFYAMVCEPSTGKARFAYPEEKKAGYYPLGYLNCVCGVACCTK